MPRYRLFGDTVQVASLLNATGEGDYYIISSSQSPSHYLLLGVSAMKIHVSMETKILLDSVGGYFLEPRGLLVVEGGDQRETFWLTGKENGGFDAEDKFDLTDMRSHKGGFQFF